MISCNHLTAFLIGPAILRGTVDTPVEIASLRMGWAEAIAHRRSVPASTVCCTFFAASTCLTNRGSSIISTG
ncbi:hypothetical protein Y886_35865 [Xanthomonas hyacinthi DSM 19077]|nr:hypothetical protein Y886_35865 [Xanthomonas hyacinthi DSM 19077]